MNLTPKQEAFCQAYILLGDKSAAYRSAYDADNMQSNTIHERSCRLSNESKISARIKKLQQETMERNKVKIDEVISVLTDMIRFDISELYDENGVFKSIHDIPKEHRQMISSINVFEEFAGRGDEKELVGFVKDIKTLSKLDAIEKLMKHLGGYEVDNKQKTPTIDIENEEERRLRIDYLKSKLDKK